MLGTAVDAFRRRFTLVAVGATASLGIACGPPPHGTIGAILGQQTDGRVFIRDAPADLAAAKAGLRPGDELLFIDGVQASSLSPEELSQLLGGPVGEPVQLTVLRSGEVLRMTVTRSEARRYSSNLKSGQ